MPKMTEIRTNTIVIEEPRFYNIFAFFSIVPKFISSQRQNPQKDSDRKLNSILYTLHENTRQTIFMPFTCPFSKVLSNFQSLFEHFSSF